jgi:coproporphyrinogen III oxidase-like Fe-S oxidoreductase
MTGFGVELDPPELAEAPRALGSLLADGLVHLEGRTLVVPPEGRAFLRNAAAFFDEYLQRGAANGPLYSTSV